MVLIFLVANKLETKSKQEEQKKEKFSEVSPDGKREIIMYELPFDGKSQLDYHNYVSNQFLFVIRELDSWRETYLFINDYKTGNPHWLGNEFVFFTSGCGTACTGLYLVNTLSKETRLGVLSFSNLENSKIKTHFKDWFGQNFEFTGGVTNIRSVTLSGEAYLVFQTSEGLEKKFRFIGKSLVP